MVIGDLQSVAFEVIFSGLGEGKVFIYIHGRKFGNDKFDYDLTELCLGFSGELKKPRNYPRLMKYSAADILALRECVLDDYENDECLRFKDIGIDDEDIDNIFFYAPIYTFDSYGVALIQGVEEERLCFYDENERPVDAVLKRGAYYSLIEETMAHIRRTIARDADKREV